jgi:hypothetical protein
MPVNSITAHPEVEILASEGTGIGGDTYFRMPSTNVPFPADRAKVLSSIILAFPSPRRVAQHHNYPSGTLGRKLQLDLVDRGRCRVSRHLAFGKLLDLYHAFLPKGRKVYCEDRLHSRGWTDNEGRKKVVTEIMVESRVAES